MTGRRQVRPACGALLKTHSDHWWKASPGVVFHSSDCPYRSCFLWRRILTPPCGRPLVYVRFLSFLLIPDDVLGLPCHLSEGILRRERSACEELTSLTGSSLTQAGVCTAAHLPLWPVVVATHWAPGRSAVPAVVSS